MPSTEEIAAARKVLNLKANPSSSSTDIKNAKDNLVKTKVSAAKTALNSPDPEEQINAASEAGEEMHPEGCKCTDCVQHPEGCKCGCQGHEEAGEEAHDEDCPCQQCEWERAHKHHDMSHNESTQITNFIKALSQKNYASANKYLQGAVESKLKRSINNANNK